MDEIHYCQMQTKEGLSECGFLCGSICRANPKKPFVIDFGFHERIKTIGCQSWQRYMDYGERRERYGQKALDAITEGGPETQGLPDSTEGRRDRGAVPLQEMPVKPELGPDRAGSIAGPAGEDGQEAHLPMPVLRPGCDDREGNNPAVEQSPRCDLGNTSFCLGPCSFCKEPAVLKDMGLRYCPTHAKKMRLLE